MRISGSGNVLQKREDTLKHKLPQVDIAKGTAHGNSSIRSTKLDLRLLLFANYMMIAM